MALLEVDEAGMRLRGNDGNAVDIAVELVQQSGLLADVMACADFDAASEHHVPVREESLLLWMRQVRDQRPAHNFMNTDKPCYEAIEPAIPRRARSRRPKGRLLKIWVALCSN